MINRITEEIDRCINENLLIAGLTLTLTLIDACAKLEYQNESNKETYTEWYNRFILGKLSEVNLGHEFIFAFPNGNEIYDLRCNMLRESNPKIEESRLKMFFSNKDLLFSRTSTGTIVDGKTEWKHDDSINVRIIVEILVDLVKEYYSENEEKFEKVDFTVFTNE